MSPKPLVVDFEGGPLGELPQPGWGPATLLLAPVADALKKVDQGLVLGGVDRDQLALVAGFAVDPETAARLGPRPPVGEALYRAVTALGVVWQATEIPGPRRHRPGTSSHL
jgi:hypothetical protein